jgi:predicted DsbA family dithiol-disulfide isomerase
MAIESLRVTADVVEVQEYPDLAQAYAVRGVPKTVINDRVSFAGAVPESTFLQRVLEAVGAEAAEESSNESDSGQSTPLG